MFIIYLLLFYLIALSIYIFGMRLVLGSHHRRINNLMAERKHIRSNLKDTLAILNQLKKVINK